MRVILDYTFDWLPFALGVPILIATGFTMLADEFKAFKGARVCFYVATAWIYGKVLMWAYLTSDKFHVRGVVALLVFGMVGVGLTETLRLTTHRETKEMNPHPRPPTPPAAASRRLATVPDGMTLSPAVGEIRLTFKSAPAYTPYLQKRIIGDLTKFRDYLIQLGIPVPKDLPPIGTTETKTPDVLVGSGFHTTPGLPSYHGGLIIDKAKVKDRDAITGLYCDYVMGKLLTGPDSPFTATTTDMKNFANALMVMQSSSTYLNFSFWNRPQKKRPMALSAPLAGALWDIREQFGRDFADKMLGFTLRSMRDEPMGNTGESVNDYFLRKLKVGASVVDNEGSSWTEIEKILYKNNFPFVWN
jgi:hypothetical protein